MRNTGTRFPTMSSLQLILRTTLWRLLVSTAVGLAPGCGARSVDLDGDAGAVNVNSNPDAIAPGVSTVVEDQESAVQIVVDDTRIYWYEASSGWGDAKPTVYARVRSCLKSDCPSTITTYHSVPFDEHLAPREIRPSSLAVGGGNVVWAEFDGSSKSSILACPTGGCAGTARPLPSNVDPTSLAVDESYVYCTSNVDTVVYRLPLSGTGTPEAIALNQEGPGAIVVSGEHVYWIERTESANSAIKRVAKQGGEAPLTLATGQNQAVALTVDSEFVYWINSDSGSIRRCPLSGCTGEPTVLVSHQTFPRALAVDGKSLFWTTVIGTFNWGQSPSRAAVMRCPVAGCEGAMETLAVQTFYGLGMSMAVDETHLYWVAQGIPEPTNFYPHATIYRYAK